jgi:hypothetical protein
MLSVENTAGAVDLPVVNLGCIIQGLVVLGDHDSTGRSAKTTNTTALKIYIRVIVLQRRVVW